MANLLPRSQAPFPALTEEQRARVKSRARFLVRGAWARLRDASAEAAHALAAELDELDEAPSPALAEALLAELDARRAALPDREDAARTRAGEDGAVRILLYRPGRSLRSGEAEAASRGYFDVADRPPVLSWLEVVARPRAEGSGEVEVGVLCGVPEEAVAVAGDGVRACGSGGVVWVDEAGAALAGVLPVGAGID